MKNEVGRLREENAGLVKALHLGERKLRSYVTTSLDNVVSRLNPVLSKHLTNSLEFKKGLDLKHAVNT